MASRDRAVIPGHYGLVPNWSTLERELHKVEGSSFKGFQIRYYWRDLEPTKDAYDFSAIEADLKVLTDRGLRLVVQLQDKSFSATPGVPGYLLQDPTYGGGVLPQGPNASMPLLWNQQVLGREQACSTRSQKGSTTSPISKP
jgi:hypothetical protein